MHTVTGVILPIKLDTLISGLYHGPVGVGACLCSCFGRLLPVRAVGVTFHSIQGNTELIKSLADRRLALSVNVAVADY